MSVIVGVDSYVDEETLTSYAAARGKTLRGDASVALIAAMDYLNIQPWTGEKTDPDQELDFPRNGDTEVPKSIKQVQCAIALLSDSGVDLLAPIGPAVKREKVDVIETEYQDNAGSITLYPQIEALLGPFLPEKTGTSQFKVGRA